MANEIIAAILARRSRRNFSKEIVADHDIEQIITAGIWAPSGKNNQPWRFVIITDEDVRQGLSSTTIYSRIVQEAPVLLAVFMDKESSYDEVKDHQAIGACLQNMLLACESLGLGAVWLGQIINNKEEVNNILDIDDQFDLMAVLAIGHPSRLDQQSVRKSLSEVIMKRI